MPSTPQWITAMRAALAEYFAAHPAPPGASGQSAYQLAVSLGFSGTEAQWLASLKGDPGLTGAGVPVGGTPGQVLGKTGAGDYATGWVTQVGGGGLHAMPWYFPGALAAANHDAYIYTPPPAIWGSNHVLRALTATFGSGGLPNGGVEPTYRFAVLFDGAEVAAISVNGSQTLTSLNIPILGTTRINVALTLVGGSGGYIVPRDATITLWWE